MVQLPSGEVQNAIDFLVLFYLAVVLRLDPLDDERRRGKLIAISDLSVSYTHLTLPTICSV